jgi:hypothetical protein
VPGGWLSVDDVIQKGMLLDKETWEVPWECKKPTAMRYVFPKFPENTHSVNWATFKKIIGGDWLPADWV